MITLQPKLKTNAPDEVYSRLVEIRREISRYQTWTSSEFYPSDALVRCVCSWMDDYIGRDNRNKFLSECYRREIKSSKDLTASEKMGLVVWGGPMKDEGGQGVKQTWHASKQFYQDIKLIQRNFGQLEFIQENPK